MSQSVNVIRLLRRGVELSARPNVKTLDASQVQHYARGDHSMQAVHQTDTQYELCVSYIILRQPQMSSSIRREYYKFM